MPKMSGVECSREVRRAGIKVFICGATGTLPASNDTRSEADDRPPGNALSDDQTEYLEAGADKSMLPVAQPWRTELTRTDSCIVLTKPIKQASLLEALEEARLRVAGLTHPKGELSDNPYLST